MSGVRIISALSIPSVLTSFQVVPASVRDAPPQAFPRRMTTVTGDLVAATASTRSPHESPRPGPERPQASGEPLPQRASYDPHAERHVSGDSDRQVRGCPGCSAVGLALVVHASRQYLGVYRTLKESQRSECSGGQSWVVKSAAARILRPLSATAPPRFHPIRQSSHQRQAEGRQRRFANYRPTPDKRQVCAWAIPFTPSRNREKPVLLHDPTFSRSMGFQVSGHRQKNDPTKLFSGARRPAQAETWVD